MKLEHLPLSKYYFEESSNFFVFLLRMLLPAIIGYLLHLICFGHVISAIFMGIIIFMYPVFMYQILEDVGPDCDWLKYISLIFSLTFVLSFLFIIDIIISPFIWFYNKYNYISTKDLFEGKIGHAKIYSYILKKEHEKQLSNDLLLRDLFLQVINRQLGKCSFHLLHRGLMGDANIRDKACFDKQTACVFKIIFTDTNKTALIAWYFVIFEIYEDFQPAIIRVKDIMFSETENGAIEELHKFKLNNGETVDLRDITGMNNGTP